MQDWEQAPTAAAEREELLDRDDGLRETPDDLSGALDAETGDEPADAADLPQLQAEYRRLAAPLGAVAKIRANDPRALERLDAALKRLPPGETLGQTLDNLRERAEGYLHAARRERIAAFRPIEAEWVRAARDAGKGLRERSAGWRVDMLELGLQREQARARFFYNREPLTPWSPIGTAADPPP